MTFTSTLEIIKWEIEAEFWRSFPLSFKESQVETRKDFLKRWILQQKFLRILGWPILEARVDWFVRSNPREDIRILYKRYPFPFYAFLDFINWKVEGSDIAWWKQVLAVLFGTLYHLVKVFVRSVFAIFKLFEFSLAASVIGLDELVKYFWNGESLLGNVLARFLACLLVVVGLLLWCVRPIISPLRSANESSDTIAGFLANIFNGYTDERKTEYKPWLRVLKTAIFVIFIVAAVGTEVWLASLLWPIVAVHVAEHFPFITSFISSIADSSFASGILGFLTFLWGWSGCVGATKTAVGAGVFFCFAKVAAGGAEHLGDTAREATHVSLVLSEISENNENSERAPLVPSSTGSRSPLPFSQGNSKTPLAELLDSNGMFIQPERHARSAAMPPPIPESNLNKP